MGTPLLRVHAAPEQTGGRVKYEYCVVLRVRAPSWKDAVLSRFVSDDKRMAEGREKAEEVIQSLRESGLIVKVKKHLAKDGAKLLMCFLTADRARLEQQSHRLFIERWLQEEGIHVSDGINGSAAGSREPQFATARPARPSMRVVRVGGLHYFAPANDPSADAGVAASGEHSGRREARGTGGALSAAGRVELIDHIVRSPKSQGGAGLDELIKTDRHKVIQHVFPLHDRRFNTQLLHRARTLNPYWGRERDDFLHDLRLQFGEKVAFYYAFNLFYTQWLLLPALIGTILFLGSFVLDESQIQQLSPIFAVCMAVWASAFIKAWVRYANRLSLEWGVLNRQQAEVVRRGYHGAPRISPITNEMELHYPNWKRCFKYVLSFAVIMLQTAFIVALVALLYTGYFVVQSTDMSLYYQTGLNLSLSSIWGILLEFLNWVIFFKVRCGRSDPGPHQQPACSPC